MFALIVASRVPAALTSTTTGPFAAEACEHWCGRFSACRRGPRPLGSACCEGSSWICECIAGLDQLPSDSFCVRLAYSSHVGGPAPCPSSTHQLATAP